MKLIDYIEDQVPCWALSYFVNGDASGITEEEQTQADQWFDAGVARLTEKYPGCHIHFDVEDHNEGYFDRYPAFGLPCDTIAGALFALMPDDCELPEIESPWQDEEATL